jgi:hypothetical protein
VARAPVVLMDEFGPPQMRNLGFYFRSVFRVLDGTRLEGDSDSESNGDAVR